MATTYDFIAQNKRRTWLLVLLFPITFALLGLVFLFAMSYISETQKDPTTAYTPIIIDEVDYGTVPAVRAAVNTASFAIIVIPFLWLFAIVWILISYFMGDHLLLDGAGAIEIYRKDQPEIYRLVENLCIREGLPLPRIYIINDGSLNAFATGRDPQHASVALTVGIIKRLEPVELEGGNRP